jgi:hypothetical protein
MFSAMVAAATVLTASGCGSGGGDGQTAGIDRGGAPIATSGPISGFGSVIVNGIRFDTSSTSITIDGQSGSTDDLAVGQIVTVQGVIDDNGNATADAIEFNDNVEGPISSIDTTLQQFVVLNQIVQINDGTSFDDDIVPRSLDGLAVGEVIEVSGFVDANGDIVATHIERHASGGVFEIMGLISDLNTTTQSFQVGALTVDYSAATLEDFLNTGPANGDIVEVKGTDFSTGGDFLATRVERKIAGLVGGDGDEAKLERLVTRIVSASEFDLSGQRVIVTPQTEYKGGSLTDLALNVQVEVEGRLNSSGMLVAEKIEFRQQQSDVRLTGNVEAVDVTAGTVTLGGVPVRVNSSTRIEDKSDTQLQPFGLADIRVGDFLEVRAQIDTDGQYTATRLERDEPDRGDFEIEDELRGVITTVSGTQFSVLGFTVQTDAATEFRDLNRNRITQAQFFAQMLVGQSVKVEGVLSGTTLLAREVELED